MRKPISTKNLQRIIKTLPTLTDDDILTLHRAVTQFINLRRAYQEQKLLGHEKATHEDVQAVPSSD